MCEWCVVCVCDGCIVLWWVSCSVYTCGVIVLCSGGCDVVGVFCVCVVYMCVMCGCQWFVCVVCVCLYVVCV